MEKNTEVLGALLLGYAASCMNLKYITPDVIKNSMREIQPEEWYPLGIMRNLENTIIDHFENPNPVFEIIGTEMMYQWYRGIMPEKKIINGIDFLKSQLNSKSYYSVVKGPTELIGEFYLDFLDEEKGIAVIKSSTPSPMSLEKGIIYGGMKAPGDLSKIDIIVEDDSFRIRFF